MYGTLKIIFLILLAIVLFLGGGALGIYYQSHQAQEPVASSSESDKVLQKLVSTMNSDLILTTTAHGIVTNIDGTKITLTNGEDSLLINIGDTAEIGKFAYNEEKKAFVLEASDFSSIGIGKTLDVEIEMMQDGTANAVLVRVYPAQ